MRELPVAPGLNHLEVRRNNKPEPRLQYKKSGRNRSVLLSEATEEQKLDWLAYRRAEREKTNRDADERDRRFLGLVDEDTSPE